MSSSDRLYDLASRKADKAYPMDGYDEYGLQTKDDGFLEWYAYTTGYEKGAKETFSKICKWIENFNEQTNASFPLKELKKEIEKWDK